MTDLLNVHSFPRFTRAKLGLPTDADLAEEVDRYLIRAADAITDAIGADAVAQLTSTDENNKATRRRFRDAYRDLVESYLWEAAALAQTERIGSSRQGQRQTTVDAASVTGARTAAAQAFERYVAGMAALGYDVNPRGIYTVPLERV